MTARVCLIGNAPNDRDIAKVVDGGEIVIRINNAFGFGSLTGSRTTHLALINCGGQMREWLEDAGFTTRPLVAAAGEILLPIHPDKDDLIDPPLEESERRVPDARNHAPEAVRMLEAVGKRVRVLDVEIFLEACRIIGYARPEREMQAPSTGLIALVWALREFSEPIDVHGFGFEGWPGHRWIRERAFFQAMQAQGRIRLHPVERP